MPLIGAGDFIRTVYNNRILWFSGRTGGGKTSLAFMVSYLLMRNYDFRYFLTNVKNVWSDLPEWVELRQSPEGGQHMDAVVCLDEAGEFIQTAQEAKAWKSYLRKLNVVLLLPSNEPPHHTLRAVRVQRLFSFGVVGLPAWLYKWDLDYGHQQESSKFIWWQPSEVFGVFDTWGYPSEATELLTLIKNKVVEAQQKTGYGTAEERTSKTGKTIPIETISAARRSDADISPGNTGAETVADIGREIDRLIEVTKRAERTVSLSRQRRNR